MAPIDDKTVKTAPVVNDGWEGRHGLITITFDWIKEIAGMMLIAELVLTFLCGCCGSSTTTWVGTGCAGRIGFLNFVAWTAFINLFVNMIIRILGLWERFLWIFRHPAVRSALFGLAVLGFLVGSSLAASCANDESTYNPATAGAAAMFGFVCLIVFGVEVYLHFQKYREMETEGRRQTSADNAHVDVI